MPVVIDTSPAIGLAPMPEPSESVEFPIIRESFQRAIYGFLTDYFDGNIHEVALNPMRPYPCNIEFDLKKLETQPLEKPTIVIAGHRLTDFTEKKCRDPNGQKPFGFEIRAQVVRSVYVAVSTGYMYLQTPFTGAEPKMPGDLLMATQVYDQLFAVFKAKINELQNRLIFNPRLTPVGAHVADTNMTILYGQLDCEIRAQYARD